MINILINAYACAPNKGSEPGMAWNWVLNLAQHCRLHVITEGEWQAEIEDALLHLPQGKNISFYYNPVSEEIRTMCWNQGDWRFYGHYKKWQRSTLQIAKELIAKEKIDIVHQLNMIGFREPGYLWQLDKPFVWGPVDAKEKFPVSFLAGASLKQKAFIHVKNTITRWQLQYSGRVRKAASKASLVLAASSESVQSFQKFFGLEAPLMNETGCYVKEAKVERDKKETFDLLWVGKFDFRKQLALALHTLSYIKEKDNIRLHLVGGDEAEAASYKELAKTLNVADNCVWQGKVSHAQVQHFMQQSDLFFFTSVAEGTPHVVLEAIGNQLPVLCFDACGQGDSVNEQVGVKIPLSNPEIAAKAFAAEIEALRANPSQVQNLQAGCIIRQEALSWGRKAEELARLYTDILENA